MFYPGIGTRDINPRSRFNFQSSSSQFQTLIGFGIFSAMANEISKDLKLEAVIGFSGKRVGQRVCKINQIRLTNDTNPDSTLFCLRLGSVPCGLQYTPCGRCVVYPLGSIIAVKSVKTKHLIFLDAEIDKKVSCVALSNDGRYLATGHETDGVTKVEAVIWDLDRAVDTCINGGEARQGDFVMHRLFQHRGKVQSLDFSCDASFLVTLGGQDDNDLVVWDVESGNGICGSPAANDTAYCVKWLNQRNDRFVTCGNYHFRVWQVCTETPKLHAVDASMGSIRRVMKCLSISKDDQFGFAGSKTGGVLKFRIDRDEIKCFEELDDQRPNLEGYNRERMNNGVKSVVCVINPLSGNTNVIAGAGDGTVQLLNPNLRPISSHCVKLDGGVTSISLDQSSKSFIVGTEFSQRYSVDIAHFTPELRGSCHYGEIFDVKFPRGCSDLFATASHEDIRVWDAKQRQESLRIRVPNVTRNAIDITPSGTSTQILKKLQAEAFNRTAFYSPEIVLIQS